ncbi:MAG: hypothetical protein KDB54_00845 [Solirubrobacterales bacterium]|nr:hypothetical protein [Solirubrobacterales bacterium]HRV58997.1 hypothetical protein [Solirubrobacterales bacterium]
MPLKKSTFRGKVIRLDKSEWKSLTGKNRKVTCDIRSGAGHPARIQRPGTRLSGPRLPSGSIWFVSLKNQAATYRKRATSGKARESTRKKLRKQANRLNSLANKLKLTCPVKSDPGSDPDPKPDPDPDPKPDPDPLTFDFRNASALALLSGSARKQKVSLRGASPSESGLIAWGQNQSAFDPVASGELDGSIMLMALAPDNDLIFVTSAALTSNTSCKLYRADFETGDVVCISAQWLTYPDQVRFDDAGNAYFWGTGFGGSDYGTYLKKSTPEGDTSDVIDPAVVANIAKTLPSTSIGEALVPFEVSPNGDVLIVVGEKLRRIKSDGTPEVVWPNDTELCGFHDGKLFVVSQGQIFTYTPGAASLDEPAWIGPPGSGATHSTTEISDGWIFSWTPTCPSAALGDGALIGTQTVSGSDPLLGPTSTLGLVEIYPAVKRLNFEENYSQITSRPSLTVVGSRLVINHRDPDDKLTIDIYDHTSDSAVHLIPPTGDLEVIHMVYSPGDDLIYFDGINYETFQNFLGTIDPDTGEQQYLDSYSGDLGQIFAFN